MMNETQIVLTVITRMWFTYIILGAGILTWFLERGQTDEN